MKKIAILASGNGTNAEAIIEYFKSVPTAKVVLIGSNNEGAYVLERAKSHQIQSFTFSKKELENGSVKAFLLIKGIDLIVLAGFMMKVPEDLINVFPKAIVNIHPALLPKYGGKGMYGMHVHCAVKEAGEKETGITIHWVNEHYDEGEIILQEKVVITEDDTPEQIAQKVHELEYKYYPKVIESLI
ncbi:Phosphoribosylglycinamide formyltransferase [Lunatimonas lonarensis]|uniref:Phosphoribosylglycinamide formyltransferase n=1 Tax=Lunatimonas lonarensis TaxID=1232681 RepID=R7ZNR3_9BACT|nr:phosphoribosylglycinamide formyltransferase [Lunatimonas lonarensis]EON75664.1 Phosphoribosylglycinamide formyltransferase [Lunatimonas lonarensis]